jgi:hypothetical protein
MRLRPILVSLLAISCGGGPDADPGEGDTGGDRWSDVGGRPRDDARSDVGSTDANTSDATSPVDGSDATDAFAPDTPAMDAPPVDASPPSASPCVAGAGKDYQVGPGGGQLASLDLVPWESLAAGDTVRIFSRPTPYKGKFMISAHGTASAPVRICGVPGPGGARPIIDGDGATSRRTLDYGHPLHQSRSVILIKPPASAAWTDFPEFVVIEGLEIRGASPTHSFTDTAGAVHPYQAFGACVWIERGHGVVLRNNVIHDCSNGVFSKSTDDGDFAVTKDILLEGNYLYDYGVVGDDHEHGTYMQSVGVTYQFNHYGPQRVGGGGSALKDRSVGTVVRYNRIEECARSLDLVEAEDFPETATKDPRYRETFVYGNLITKSANNGIPIHYGGDHYGATPSDRWGEPIFRKGTLYFYANTVVMSASAYSLYLFQIATTEEHARIFDNVFVFTGTVRYPALRAGTELGAAWKAGGTIELGVNWMNAGWLPHDPDHVVDAPVTGATNVLTGSKPPIDLATLSPLPSSAVIGVAGPLLGAAAGRPVLFEYEADLAGRPRTTQRDLGAHESK